MSYALLVDLGGSSCRVGLADNTVLQATSIQTFANAEFDSLEHLLQTYLTAQSVRVSRLCAGIAGPVQGNTAQLTNHAWFVDGPALAGSLGADQTHLMNDLQAQAYALDDLNETAITTLIAAQPDPTGPRMTLCLGTGCNIAVAHRQGAGLFVPASESGHTTLPDAPEFRTLYDSLRGEFPHLPIEAVLSGPGLSRLHTFLTGEARSPVDIIAEKPADTFVAFARLLGGGSRKSRPIAHGHRGRLSDRWAGPRHRAAPRRPRVSRALLRSGALCRYHGAHSRPHRDR